MADDFSERYGDLPAGSCDCADRVVLNAYYPPGHNPGGFRYWRRLLHGGSDAKPDDAHLTRTAGRFARRVKARGKAHGVPVTCCTAGERKHLIAGEFPETHTVTTGVFTVLAAKAPAPVWKVKRSAAGVVASPEKKTGYACRCSFHITDPAFGHPAVEMSGHPPFGAQVILNGHEYAAVAAQAGGTGFAREGNCFTEVADPRGPARIAGAWPRDAAKGRPGRVCDRRACSACPCFGLDLAGQQRSGFRYGYPACRAGYSRNLLFASGAQTEDLSGRVLDRVRSRPGLPAVRAVFGLATRPHRSRGDGPPAQEIATGKPRYGLAWFRISSGRLQARACAKGGHVLRFEATARNAEELRCRRGPDNSGEVITRLAGIAGRLATATDCAGTGFLPDGIPGRLPLPSRTGPGRTAGTGLSRPRIRAALAAVLALAPAPHGFTAAGHAARVRQISGNDACTARQAAYDLRKLRGKQLIGKPGKTRRYRVPPGGARTVSALLTLRDHVIAPVLAGVRSPRTGRKPKIWTPAGRGCETLRTGMRTLFRHAGTETQPAAA